MDIEGEDIQTLIGLGLTALQAKIYLTLVKSGKATIKGISVAAKVDRADVYRVVIKLQNKGLVEKMIASPATFKATPIKDGISFLLQEKNMEYTTLQKKTEELLTNYQNNSYNSSTQTEDSQFFIISEKTLLYKTLDELNNSVQKSLDVAGTWERSRGALFDFEFEVFKKALKRGVRIHWITETHEEDTSTLKALQTLQKSPLFELRYFVPPIPLQTAVYDNREVSMCIALPTCDEVTSIWSNNPMFVRVVSNYWEEVWNGGLKDYAANSSKPLKQKLITS
jgi:sugar-specific transcriptional regulator TrmB